MKNQFKKCNTQWQLFRHLLSNDWKIVSEIHGKIKSGGGHSVVFISPDNIKALRINNGMWKDFALYVDVAQKLPNNPYLQNIIDTFFLNDGTYCVELESLLESGNPKTSLKTRGEYIILKNLINRPFKNSRSEMIDRLLKKDPALREAITCIHVFLENAYNQDNHFDPLLDLHGGNIMIRQTKNKSALVLIDPYTYWTKNKSPEPQNPADILWRRKLGLFDYNSDWQIKNSKCGYGTIMLD